MTRGRLAACFDALGQARCQQLRLVSADAAPWIATVVAERCPHTRLCLDPFHVARVGHRRTRPGAPRGVERGPQARADCPGARAQRCPLCAVEEPWRPDRPPAGQARLDRPGQRPPVPRLPVEGRTRGWCSRSRAPAPPCCSRRGWPGPGAAASPPSWSWPRRSPGTGPTSRPPSPKACPTAASRPSTPRSACPSRVAFGFKSPEALIALAMLSLGGLCPSLPGRG